MRWKGRFSERDIDSWTPELQSLLHFDPKSAKNFDNGNLLLQNYIIKINNLFSLYRCILD